MTVFTQTSVLEIQQAVFAHLTSGMGSDITGVFDDVPELTPYPYVSFGSHTESPWPVFQHAGNEILFLLDIWSSFAGDEECYRLLDSITHVLCDTDTGPQLTLATKTLISFTYEWSTILEETDPKRVQQIRHMPVRFHAFVQ